LTVSAVSFVEISRTNRLTLIWSDPRRLVHFLQQLPDLLLGVGLPQELAAHVHLEIAEDDIRSRQMALWIGYRAQQEKEAIDRLLAQRGEVDAGRAAADNRNHLLQARMLAVRNRHTLAEPGGSLHFALGDL